MKQAEVFSLIREIAEKYEIDADLAVAIATVESGGYIHAAVVDPDFRSFFEAHHFAYRLGTTELTEQIFQATRWGAMQVRGGIAREIGFNDPLPKLSQPKINAELGCKLLKILSDTYENEATIIAAYGAGKPRKVTPPKKFGERGVYLNQPYVDKVLEHLARLRRIG